MTYYTPKLQEDLGFCSRNWRYVEGLTTDINWHGMWDTIVFHYTYTNGRLGDAMVIPLMTLMPQWMFAIFNGIIAFALVAGVAKIISIAIPVPNCMQRLLTASTAMILIWFPWNETVFIESYAVNYLWTGCLTVWIAYTAINTPSAIISRPTLISLIAIAFFIAGTWHELVFPTLGIALVAITLISNKPKSGTHLIWIAALFAGFMINIASGGLRTRVASTALVFDFHRFYITVHHLPIPKWPVMGVVFYVFTLVISLIISNSRFTFHNILDLIHTPEGKVHCLCALTGISNLFIYAFFGFPRTLFIGDIFAVIGILVLAFSCRNRVIQRCINPFFSLLCLLLLTNLFTSILFQRKLNNTFLQIKQEWLKSDDGEIFADLPNLNFTAPYPWNMIVGDMFSANWKLCNIACGMRPDDKPKNFIILPLELEHINPSQLKPVPAADGLFQYGKHLLYLTEISDVVANKVSPAPYGYVTIEANTGKHQPETLYYQLFPFTPRSGIKTSYYLKPMIFDFDFSRQIISFHSITININTNYPGYDTSD